MAQIKKNIPYLFIHPAWRGAWCWDKVLQVMEAWGREAYAIDCPGHGSRYPEIETVALADYPKAVVEFIEERNLDDVVLVGNSTGGLMCQLTAQATRRIPHIIWYMGFILKDGESILDACPPEFSEPVSKIKDNRYPIPPHSIYQRKMDARHDSRRANS